MTSNAVAGFALAKKQLDGELHNLSSESKRRNSAVKHASDKSIEILKTVHSFDDLERHPDFVTPFILACSSRNAKLTTIAMHCIQYLSTVCCIPESRLLELLDTFSEASHLAVEIQLKVLQIIPVFFKTYSKDIYGKLAQKILLCCSRLLHVPSKSVVVVGTASATLQQLIGELFDRLSNNWAQEAEDSQSSNFIPITIKENEEIRLNKYRHDTFILFLDLCDVLDKPSPDREHLLESKDMSLDYGLEVMESILANSPQVFLTCKELQHPLQTKAVPSILRCISSSDQFATVVRSYRCLRHLIKTEFLPILELELEVVLSVLINVSGSDTESTMWKKTLSLEVFMQLSRNFPIILEIFNTYDRYPNRKHILAEFLEESTELLNLGTIKTYLHKQDIIGSAKASNTITTDSACSKSSYLQTLDKVLSVNINPTYIIWLILSVIILWSEGLNTAVLEAKDEDLISEDNELRLFLKQTIPDLFQLFEEYLYSSALDLYLFHSTVRAFQKLTHAAGLLSLPEQLDKCLNLLALATVQNVDLEKETAGDEGNNKHKEIPKKEIFNSINNSLLGPTDAKNHQDGHVQKIKLYPRNFSSKHIALFRALISLSISLGPEFSRSNWKHVILTWQWVSYYFYGPTTDFMERFYSEDIPLPPELPKNQLIALETSLNGLVESTSSYSTKSFTTFISALMEESKYIFESIDYQSQLEYYPVTEKKTLRYCIYNKAFLFTQIGTIATQNCTRFVKDDASKQLWTDITKHMIYAIGSRDMSSMSLRLHATRILTDIMKNCATILGSSSDQEVRNSNLTTLESLVINTLIDIVKALKKLPIANEEILNGTATIESKIMLQMLSTLKETLNEFGDFLDDSWLIVFKILNSPFEWIDINRLVKQENNDDSSMVNAFLQQHKEMVQVSYDVFKLVFDDFLQNLPITTINNVIDNLVSFARQETNINISFSSISHFWLIGDYLRTRMSSDAGQKTESNKSEDNHSSTFEQLWIYLLKSLMICTEDSRLEIKKGAIQTFFRIVDSHSKYLPAWDSIFDAVLQPLLKRAQNNPVLVQELEFWDNVLQGIVNLYSIHLLDNSDYNGEWTILIELLSQMISSKEPEVSFVATKNYTLLLQRLEGIDILPKALVMKIVGLWCNYSVMYGDVLISSGYLQKSGYDCVYEMLSSFSHLYALTTRYDLITVALVEKILVVFNGAVRYPLLPENTRDNKRPSSLQGAVISGLKCFENIKDVDILSLVLLQLSSIMVLPFETREKIERKLLPKLSEISKSRIPTFSAISYETSQYLIHWLEIMKDMPFSGGKHTLRTMRNVGEVILKKSDIDLSKEQDMPMWLLASECFEIISLRLFAKFDEDKSSNHEEFCGIFVKVSTAPLHNWQEIETKGTDRGKQKADYSKEYMLSLDAYRKFRHILLKPQVVKLMSTEQLDFFVSNVWTSSFLYKLDAIEDALINTSKDLPEISRRLSQFDFGATAGSVKEPLLVDNYACSICCLKDLLHLVLIDTFEVTRLRNIAIPYLVVRAGFALRRYISDQELCGLAPVPKVRRIELDILLKGLQKLLDTIATESDSVITQNLKQLYPLVLRTIPLAHKMNELEGVIVDLSLNFTKLVTNKDI